LGRVWPSSILGITSIFFCDVTDTRDCNATFSLSLPFNTLCLMHMAGLNLVIWSTSYVINIRGSWDRCHVWLAVVCLFVCLVFRLVVCSFETQQNIPSHTEGTCGHYMYRQFVVTICTDSLVVTVCTDRLWSLYVPTV
jgi:hypothetical protein